MCSLRRRGPRAAAAGVLYALAVFLPGIVAPQELHAQRRPVTFNRDVAPVLYANCTSCHRDGEVAPFNLLTYDDAKQRARLIVDATEHRLMPPWKPAPDFGEFEGERRLEVDEIQVFRLWLADGLLEGDPRDLPPLPRFTTGWQLGEPDLVVTMPEPLVVPAEGGDVYRNIVLAVPTSARRYVEAVEFRSGNPRALHHARILLDDTHELRRRDEEDPGPGFGGMEAPGARFPDGHFLGWAPGKMPAREPLAWPLDPGTDLVVQLHLKPSGRSEPVQVSIGLHFTDKRPSDSPVMLRLDSKTIDIPPGASSYQIVDSYVLPVDVRVLSIYPHAHYLAGKMTVVARLRDGSTRGLLHIPEWDFKWQDDYAYRHPVDLPRGATIVMTYTYNNSADNPRNPHLPPRRVRFGPETTDEMGELLVQLLPRNRSHLPILRADVLRKTIENDVAGEEKLVLEHPEDYETRNALGVHYVRLGRLDEATGQFEAALALAPEHAVSHYNLAVIAMQQQRPDAAFAHFQRALTSRPDYVEAHTNLGVLLEQAGQAQQAETHYRLALMANADHLAAHNNLGRLLLRQGRQDAALEHFEVMRRLRPASPTVLDTLATAYAEVGRIDEAISTARAAFEAALAAEDQGLARTIRRRLETYEGLP